jgi:P27 family predicted phage terminase small subunit
MARTGRPSKAIEHHMKAATLRSDRHSSLPLLEGGRGPIQAPDFLNEDERLAFDTIVCDMEDSGILDRGDSMMVLLAALSFGLLMKARRSVQDLGTAYAVTRGTRGATYKVMERNPNVGIQIAAQAEFRQCCDLLGIGPSARARLANAGLHGRDAFRDIAGLGEEPELMVLPGHSED